MVFIYIIKLNSIQLNNLKIFMSRVQLTGQEVVSYVEVVKAINEAKEVQPEKVGD